MCSNAGSGGKSGGAAAKNQNNEVMAYSQFTDSTSLVKVANASQRLTKSGISNAIDEMDAMDIESGKSITINGIKYEAWTGAGARNSFTIGKKQYETITYQATTGYVRTQTKKGAIVDYPMIEIPLEIKTRKSKGSTVQSYSIAKNKIRLTGAVDMRNGLIFFDD